MYCLAAAPSKVGTLDGPVELETEEAGCSGTEAGADGAGAGVAGEEAGQFVCSGPHEVMVTTVEDSTVWVRRAAALVETITAANETRVENCIVI